MHDEQDSTPAASSRKKMAIQLYEHSQTEQQAQSFLCDTLYCEEEGKWEEEEGEGVNVNVIVEGEKDLSSSVSQHDLFWEDEELVYLFSKEVETDHINNGSDPDFILGRGEAIEWILKVVGHYGFTPLTTILSINYLNRFLLGLQFQREENPWMTQLVAVACLSLAAKVEETQVPFLLDLQVGDAEFLFDAKTVLKMELLVLSTLQWRMNPVTPFSFLDHIMRRLWLQNGLQWDFRRRCERLLVSVVSDWKSLSYKPSVLAAATMLEVIHDQFEPWKAVEYQEQLLAGVLKISQDEVNDCWELIRTILQSNLLQKKRKHDYEEQQEHIVLPASPNGVIDAAVVTCDDNSNDSWEAVVDSSSSSVPFVKKRKNK
ncbi:cyclin-D3-1-like [Impatiens glandulifera]|uniref:cyclin-D3-1-like n=1 Tax=Impatiens glandulifera TaxID=253017 RepID=UPI001FB119C2|nr:cyclin-D3-1-like [Impatiens glandulifera]